jgi:hypothetical protein
MSSEMPAGIGVRKTIEGKDATKEDVFIDPMTKEVISKVADVDEAGKKVTDRQGNQVYQINDHWFVLNLKLKWKDALVPAGITSTPGGTAAVKAGQPTSTPSGGGKTSGKSAGGGSKSKTNAADF